MPIWFSKNGGNWNNDALADPATGSGGLSLHGVAGQTLYIICQGSDASITLNSGASVFSYSVPAGFSPWAGSVGGFTTFDPTKVYGSAALSAGNLHLATPTIFGACQSIDGHSTGKWYFEITNVHNTVFTIFNGGGVGRLFPGLDYNFFASNAQYNVGDVNGGGVAVMGAVTANLATCGVVGVTGAFPINTGDVVRVAVQMESLSLPLTPPLVSPPTGGTFTGSKAQIADLWFGDTTTFFDLSVEANRRKFIDINGCTVDLGANGQQPTGTQPPVFLHIPPGGTAAQFANNYGSAGAYTINNPPLALAATAPCCGQSSTPGSSNPQPKRKLLIWNGKVWCSSNQDVALTSIATQEVDSVQTAYGSDGTSIFPLFARPSTAFVKTIQSKLFSQPGTYATLKAPNRFWGVLQYNLTVSATLTVLIDSEKGSQINTINPTIPTGGLTVLDPQAIAQWGALNGMTIQTSASDVTLIGFMMAAEVVQYRG